MMNTKVKICGIATPEDYTVCAEAGAAFIGMVFFPRSPRHLSLETARVLAAHGDQLGADAPRRVALTVDMPDNELDAVVAAARPHYIQLHGTESPERATAINQRYGLPLIKAIRVGSREDLDVCAGYEGIVDWLLFDAKGDPGGLPGGTGHQFDWSLLAGRAGSTQWMLAGGLGVENVARAITATRAIAVDVSSGVEEAPGKKDPARIRAFVSAAILE